MLVKRAIVGRGTAALVNIATLPDSDGIVCLGGPDPWQSYYPSRTGQWPVLFSMPGYATRLDAVANEWDFAQAADVAAMNQRQAVAAGIAGSPDEWVTEIADSGSGGFVVRTAAGQEILAEQVDICGGAGPARQLRVPSSNRTMTGEQFLSLPELPATVQRMAVLGGGPTAAWCVERAVLAGLEVTWASRDSFAMAFPPSGRNDHLVRGPLRRFREHGQLKAHGPFEPAFSSLTLLPKSDTAALAQDPGQRFDLIVAALGPERDASVAGTWAHLVSRWIPPDTKDRRHWKVDAFGRTCGLQSMDGRLRLLGAAALNHPVLRRALKDRPPAGPLGRFAELARSLPMQAGDGLALAAVLVASANGYFSPERPNGNLNTAGLEELEVPLGRDAAAVLYAIRRNSIHPFTGSAGCYYHAPSPADPPEPVSR